MEQWTHFDVVDELGAETRVPVELIPQGLRRALLNQVDRLRVWVWWGSARGQRSTCNPVVVGRRTVLIGMLEMFLNLRGATRGKNDETL